MPVTEKSFENFYLGSSAESHLASLFYFAGYEASKPSPDPGVDLLVTNLARAKFKGDPEITAKVQVKSTVWDAAGAKFYLTEEELAYLSTGEDRFTVFAMFGGFVGEIDRASLDIYVDRVDLAIEEDMSRNRDRDVAKDWHGMKKANLASIFDFSKFDLNVFWLNTAQMARAKTDGIWRKMDRDLYQMRVRTDDSLICIEVPVDGGASSLSPIARELTEVRYIMKPCRSDYYFKQGRFLLDHL